MRLLITLLVIWLIFFYSVERLSEPINISRVAYPFAPLMAILILLVPRLRKMPLWTLLVTPLPIFLVLKAWAGYHLWGTALPITVTEVCIISVTTILAHLVSGKITEFEHAIARITIGQPSEPLEPYAIGQAEMYREVKRARHHNRPLTMLSIGIVENSIQIALDRLVQEAQQTMMKQYILCSVAKVLCDGLEDYDKIVQRDEHFLILLPELTPNESSDLAKQLRQDASQQIGIDLLVGVASFPADAVTFESLVEKAIEKMQKDKTDAEQTAV
jgi:hypothetical protein